MQSSGAQGDRVVSISEEGHSPVRTCPVLVTMKEKTAVIVRFSHELRLVVNPPSVHHIHIRLKMQKEGRIDKNNVHFFQSI